MAQLPHKERLNYVREVLFKNASADKKARVSRVISKYIEYSTEAMLNGYNLYRSGYGFFLKLDPKDADKKRKKRKRFSSRAIGIQFDIKADIGGLVKSGKYRFVPDKKLVEKLYDKMETDVVYKILKK